MDCERHLEMAVIAALYEHTKGKELVRSHREQVDHYVRVCPKIQGLVREHTAGPVHMLNIPGLVLAYTHTRHTVPLGKQVQLQKAIDKINQQKKIDNLN